MVNPSSHSTPLNNLSEWVSFVHSCGAPTTWFQSEACFQATAGYIPNSLDGIWFWGFTCSFHFPLPFWTGKPLAFFPWASCPPESRIKDVDGKDLISFREVALLLGSLVALVDRRAGSQGSGGRRGGMRVGRLGGGVRQPFSV